MNNEEIKIEADRLENLFRPNCHLWDCYNDIPVKERHYTIAAIKCVNEIIKEHNDYFIDLESEDKWMAEEKIKWHKDVKKELESRL